MEQITTIVERVLKKVGNKKEEPLDAILKKTLTKRELAHIKFNYFRKGILGIGVDSSVWIYQLNLQKEKLLVKLSKHIPKIKDIRFFLGEVQ